MKSVKGWLVLFLIAAAVFLGVNEANRANRAKSNEENRKNRLSAASVKISAHESDAQSQVERAKRLGERVPREEPQLITTESGLQYEVLEEGEGDHPGPTSTVEVHYEGRLADGTLFDSSRVREQSATFPLNAVIKGWTEGLQLMKPGAKYRFTIPSNLAYGDKGAATIPADATLIFEVELIDIKKP